MKRFLRATTVGALLVAQQGAALEAAAQSFRASAPAQGVQSISAASAGVAPLNAAGAGVLPGSMTPSAGLLPSSPASAFLTAPSAAAAPAAAAPAAAALPSAFSPAVPDAPASQLSAAASDGPAAARASAETARVPKSGSTGVLARLRRALSRPSAAAPAPEAALTNVFDGAVSASAAPALGSSEALPASRIKAYLVRPGRNPVAVSLSELPGAAAGDFAAAFNNNGHLRVILGEGNLKGPTLAESDVPGMKDVLRAAGLIVNDKRVRTEAVPVKEAPDASAPETAPAETAAPAKSGLLRPTNLIRTAAAAAIVTFGVLNFGTGNILGALMLAGLAANVDRIVRELSYAAGMLKVSFKESKSPRWNEIVGGGVSKIIPAVINIGIFATMYNAHPLALVLAASLSLSVETFHGVWVNAWDTFQSKIGRHRGMLYQNLFNFFYGQMISGSYRLIAYLSLGNVAPPWSFAYWKDMSMMTIIGTFCGTLGYRGLNSIYEKGRIPRWGRAGIQQLRDFCMMMIGPFFGTGNMFMTWLLFGVMQSVDIGIFIIDRMLATRPIVYVADERVAGSEAFQAIYIDKPSPLKQALDGVKSFILVKPFVAAYRWLRSRNAKPAQK